MTKFINNILNKNFDDASKSIRSTLLAKLNDKLCDRRLEIAQDIKGTSYDSIKRNP